MCRTIFAYLKMNSKYQKDRWGQCNKICLPLFCEVKKPQEIEACAINLFSSELSHLLWTTLIFRRPLSHFTSPFQVRHRESRTKIWCEIDRRLLILHKMCEQCGLCGASVGILTHDKSFTAVGMTQHHQGFTSLTVRCHVWLSRQSCRCYHRAASLYTWERPRSSTQPWARQSAGVHPSLKGRLESGSKRALCREMDLPVCSQYVTLGLCETENICIIPERMVDAIMTWNKESMETQAMEALFVPVVD